MFWVYSNFAFENLKCKIFFKRDNNIKEYIVFSFINLTIFVKLKHGYVWYNV